MTSRVRRAAAFALVASLALAAPVLGRASALPFALVAAAAFTVSEGRVFELFARPSDRREGRLNGLAGFALGATALAVLTAAFGMPVGVFVATVLLVGYGNLAAVATRGWRSAPVWSVVGFAVGGFLGAVAGLVVAAAATGAPVAPATVTFLAASGALLGALVESVFPGREDPLALVLVALLLWLFADIGVAATTTVVAVGLGVTLAFGYLSYALDTASIPGMLTGVFLGLLTTVLGGYRWFVVLIAFFGVGGLSTKFRYEEKRRRGVAEERGGARGSGNVLGNSAAATAAVLLYAAAPSLGVTGAVFLFAFAGSLATALADTLSSEVGGLYSTPRLITTLEPVPAGTDGAVTWQGELAGLAGTGLVAALAGALFGLGSAGAGAVAVAGVLGMTADSLLGATVEGGLVGNQTVNFLATLVGAVAGALLAVGAGAVTVAL